MLSKWDLKDETGLKDESSGPFWPLDSMVMMRGSLYQTTRCRDPRSPTASLATSNSLGIIQMNNSIPSSLPLGIVQQKLKVFVVVSSLVLEPRLKYNQDERARGDLNPPVSCW